MIINILKHTPPWVFLIFLALLALGYSQSKNREVQKKRVLILPGAMLVLSAYGIFSAFGISLLGISMWLIGIATAMGLTSKIAFPQGVSFSPKANSFYIPGSWLPLTLMMAIFFTKYAVGAALAMQPLIVQKGVFIGLISLAYGIFSGIFLARALFILRTEKLTLKSPALE